MAAILILACVVSLISFAAFSENTLISSEFFSLNVDSIGQEVCFSEIPTMEQFVASNSECALVCVGQIECIHYNYLKSKSLCQLFYNNAKSLAKTNGCRSYTNMVKNLINRQ